MLQSKVYELTQDGFQLLGAIGSSEGKLFCKPQNETLSRMCQAPIMCEDGLIEPTDSDAFVKSLYLQYRSAYLMATKAEEEGNDNAE